MAIIKFISWNTAPNGTGEDISTYNRTHGGCQGPVTFYAIYMQNRYDYTGYVQAFTAPVSGWYQIECYGAEGGGEGSADYALGGYARGEIHLSVNQTLYVVVGEMGGPGYGGWNGGGSGGSSKWGGGGGSGATDVRTASAGTGSGNWEVGLWNRIIVAGGGGGSDDPGHIDDDDFEGAFNDGWGGAGGGASGGWGHENDRRRAAPGTQNSGYAFGYGQAGRKSDAGGGGGGWYGGYGGVNRNCGGGGGSGYTGGMPRNTTMSSGVNRGNGYALFHLLERD